MYFYFFVLFFSFAASAFITFQQWKGYTMEGAEVKRRRSSIYLVGCELFVKEPWIIDYFRIGVFYWRLAMTRRRETKFNYFIFFFFLFVFYFKEEIGLQKNGRDDNWLIHEGFKQTLFFSLWRLEGPLRFHQVLHIRPGAEL